MEQSKYENLLERSIAAQENNAYVYKGLLEVSKDLKANLAKMNDQFILHCTTNEEVHKEVKIIRKELLNYLKWVIVILIAVLGGKQIISLVIDKI